MLNVPGSPEEVCWFANVTVVLAVREVEVTTAMGGMKTPGGGTRSPLPQPEEKPEGAVCGTTDVSTVDGTTTGAPTAVDDFHLKRKSRDFKRTDKILKAL